MDSEKGTANEKRQTPSLSTDALNDDPSPANDHVMERLKKPSIWKRMADKLGLSIPVVIMMAKYVVPEWSASLHKTIFNDEEKLQH
jgi:hypothetical protein